MPKVEPVKLSRKAQVVLKIAMLLCGPVFLLACLEGVAYLWERAQANGPYAWEMVASRRIRLLTYPTPGAGYTLMEPGSHFTWGGIPVAVNSHGLRDPETLYEKPAGVRRVLSLGDSIVMGWGVRQEDRYGPLLETALNTQAGAGSFQVIDAGVPGWNTANELAYLEAEGLKYQPDLIVLDLTLVNDIGGKSALLKNGGVPLINWLRDHTYFYPFLAVGGEMLAARSQGKARIKTLDPPTDYRRYFPKNLKDPHWDQTWEPILQMQAVARQHGIPLVLVEFPLELSLIHI